MRIQNHLLSVLFLVSLTAVTHAQTSASSEPTFTQLSECRTHYQTTVAPGSTDLVAADTYCVSRMSVANYCAGRSVAPVNEELNACMARVNQQNAIRAQTAISQQQQAAALSAQQQQQQQAAAAAEAARVATATGSGTGTTNGNAQGNGGGMNPQATMQMVNAIAPLIDEERERAQSEESAGGGGNSHANRTGTGTPGNNNTAGTATFSTADPLTAAQGTGTTGTGIAGTLSRAGRNVASGLNAARPPVEPANMSQAQLAAEVRNLPEASRDAALQGVQDLANQTPTASTDITASAQRANQTLNAIPANADGAGSLATCFPTAQPLMQQLGTEVRDYVNKKNTCTSLAEKAEFLCVEQSSPGARAVRTILNISGPAIAIINSAQRACSSTSKVMDFASKLLTAAKGLCVAAKIACDTSCTGTASQLNTRLTATHGNLLTAIGADITTQASTVGMSAACESANQYMREFSQHSGRVLQNEANPATPGTTPALVAKCEAKMVDIAALAGNILGMVSARNSAEDCEQQLAADGSTGANVSVAQYCEQAANSSTQYCKCQRNSQQEGCPGFEVGSTGGNGEDGQSGTNIRNAAGLSNFAGAGGGITTPGGGSGSGLDGGSVDEEALGVLGSASSGSATGGLPSVGMGGGSGGGSSGATDSKTAEKKADDKDKKKWDFGSFASGVGAALGFKGKSSGNGSVSSPKEEAIQRKVASEKLAGEISSASGKSNWEKVRDQYLIKSNSLLLGQ